MDKDVTMIFCTCDAYADLWENFFILFKKYWPDFDGEIIFNTESKSYSNEGLNIVMPKTFPFVGSWSARLYNALKSCTSDKVLLILEDFYFISPVNHKAFMESVAAMENDKDLVSIAYQAQPGAYKKYPHLDGYDERRHFSQYTMNASLTLYKKEYLMSLLKNCEDAWEFEVNATVRSWFKRGKFICKSKEAELVFPYPGAGFVRHGKFEKTVKEYFEKNEGLTFSEERGILPESYSHINSGSKIGKMFKYGTKAIQSFFYRKPK